MQYRASLFGALVALLLACLAPAASADEIVVLDGSASIWRTLIGYGTPIVQANDGQLRPLRLQDYSWMPAEGPDTKPIPKWQSPAAPPDWPANDFDDSDFSAEHLPAGPALQTRQWNHAGFTMWSAGSPAQVDFVIARGRFNVLDPAKAGTMKLVVKYRGGVVVRLNGREIARGHLPDGQLTRDSLAESYPDAAYLAADGKPFQDEGNEKTADEDRARLATRDRIIEVVLPAGGLVKGVNVLSIETRRAACREVGREEPREYRGKSYQNWPWSWPHCRLLDARLTGQADGVAANVGRPSTIQLWQPGPLDTVSGFDYGNPCEPIRPIRLVGVRNANASAQVVVSCPEQFGGLKASATELKSDSGGVIPAGEVRVRFPMPGDYNRFDGLAESPPQPVPVRNYAQGRAPNVQTAKVAMQPIWITVQVPAGAAAGRYEGTVRVEADGLAVTDIPLSIQVYDWQMPAPADYATHNNLWQSHETPAISYKAPLWSDRHFELIGQSLALSGPLANKFCNVHLVRDAFQCGNTESMVRWIAKDGGGFDYDFTVLDRYLELYDKTLGKPVVLMIDVCVPFHSSQRAKDGSTAVQVSRLDPKTGLVEPMGLPPYAPPTGVEFWKPVLDEVRKRLEKRGWWDVTVIGTASDSGPTEGEARTFKEIWPDRPWIFSGHPHVKVLHKGLAEVRALEWVWGAGKIWDPAAAPGDQKYPRPWSRLPERIQVAFPRLGSGSCELYNHSLLSEYRLKPEKAMQSNENGLGRTGLDFWPFFDDRGRRRQVCRDGGQFSFNGGVGWLVAMGPEGPVITCRGQAFREGIQTAEAMAFLARAADSGKLPAEQVNKIESLLRDRAMTMLAPDGRRQWQADESRLFALCAEIARQLK